MYNVMDASVSQAQQCDVYEDTWISLRHRRKETMRMTTTPMVIH